MIPSALSMRLFPALPVAAQRPGIIAFSYVVSDDGKFALAEFVAVDRGAFSGLLADTSVKAFLKGRDSINDAVTEFLKHKANFTLDMLGAIVP